MRISVRTLVALAVCAALLAIGPAVADAKKLHHVGTFKGQPDSKVSFTIVKRGGKLVRAENVRARVTLECDDGDGNFSNRPYTKRFGKVRIKQARGITGFGWGPDRITNPGIEGGWQGFFATLSRGGKRARGSMETRYWHSSEDFCTIAGSDASEAWNLGWTSRAR
jgi:hypothetical protein